MRSNQSLIWEDASPEQTLYFYDSVLTLSQAQATLELGSGTELHLSENTLITLEPQNNGDNSEIRLKFSKGDLRARAGNSRTQIAAKEWTINLDSKAEIALKQTSAEGFEIDVLKGQMNIEQKGEVQNINENQIVAIGENNKIETLNKETSLDLDGPSFERIYTHQNNADTTISWKGPADEIQLISRNEGLRDIPIIGNSAQQKIDLPLGKYSYRIAKGKSVSSTHEIEIWKAPELHLLSPYARDRAVTAKPITFLWSEIPEAKEYIIEFQDLNTGEVQKQVTTTNFIEKTFENEGELSWSVYAVDKDGFKIPPAYSQNIFLNHELLQAPKLKAPSIRAPANKPSKQKKKNGASLMPSGLIRAVIAILFSQQIHAEEGVEAVFNWEAVPDATGYTIEISATSDFRKPLVYQKVRKTEFIWSNFTDGTYYWRVAASGDNGRMGLFSEAAKINLARSQAIDSLDPMNASTEGVLIRKKLDPEKNRAPVETKSEEIFHEAPKVQFDEKRFDQKVKLVNEDTRDLRQSYKLLWQPTSSQWNLTGQDQLKANLKGIAQGAIKFQTEQIYSENKSFLVDVYYSQYKWRPADDVTYPFQSEQNLIDSKVQILVGDNRSHLLRGAMLMMIPHIERVDLEKIEIKQSLGIGPSVIYQYDRGERGVFSHQLGLVAGSSSVALTTQNLFAYRIMKFEDMSLILGLSLQADLIFHDRNFSQAYGAGLSLGLGFP